MVVGDHGLTVMLPEVPVMVPVTVSVAAMVWVPAVFNVVEEKKVFAPAVRAELAGSTA